MAETTRLNCPKCETEGRPKCNRFHFVMEDGKQYIRCEQVSACGWKAELK